VSSEVSSDSSLPSSTVVPETALEPSPDRLNRFEFVVASSLRAAQLLRGCTPRVAPGHKLTVTARQEVAEGKIRAWRRVSQPTAGVAFEATPPVEGSGVAPSQATATVGTTAA